MLEVDVNNIEEGIELAGLKVKHPLMRDAELPVYVASYLLADQDADVCLGYPNYSKRDLAFAKVNSIEIRE